MLSKYLLFLYYGPSCVLHSDSFSVHDTGSELIMVLLKNLQHGRKNCQTSYSDIQVPSSAGHDIPFCLILTASLKKRGGSLHKSVWAPIDLRRHCSNLCLHTLCSHHPATISPYPLECDTTLPSLLWPLPLLLGFTPFTPAYTNFILGDSPCLNPCFLPVITIETAPQLQDWPCGSEPAKVILSFLPKRSRMGTARAKPGSTRSPPAPARAQGWSNQSKA